MQISLCGFVISSYTPCAKAKPVCDEKWREFDLEVAALNGKPFGEGFKDRIAEKEEDTLKESDLTETGFVETVKKNADFYIIEGIKEEVEENEALNESFDVKETSGVKETENDTSEGDRE